MIYVVKYTENSDAACKSEVRLFPNIKSAQEQVMAGHKSVSRFFMSQSEYNTNCQRQKTRISVQHLKILHSDSRSPNVAAVFSLAERRRIYLVNRKSTPTSGENLNRK